MKVELDMTPEQETVADEHRERAILAERIADADRGDFLSDDEVEARFRVMMRR
jgi:predicted transcriptional regulator